MQEKNELLEHIYQDASMGEHTTMKLISKLKDKDNKIKKALEDVYKEYEKFKKKSLKLLEEEKIKPDEKGFMSKMMSSMGIGKEVKEDNSDSAMADMMIQGVTMGMVEVEKKIKSYEKEVDDKTLSLARDFLKFQDEAIKKFREYL